MKNQPVIRLVLPLVIGIILQYHFKVNDLSLILALLIACLFYFITGYFIRSVSYDRYSYASVFILVLVLGMFVVELNEPIVTFDTSQETFMLATVDNVPKEKGSGAIATLTINAEKSDKDWRLQNFKVNAYFTDLFLGDTLKAGDKIIFNAKLEEIEGPKNPFDFDYKSYLKNKDILFNLQLENDQWSLIKGQTTQLKYIALNTRMRIIRLYERSGIYGDQLGVLSALTFGYKDKLEASIKESYSGAGAMNVLAVSGLHVAIVYKIIQLLLGFLRLFKKSEALLNAFIIGCLWCYAFIAGLSPSVVRATIMFSFVLSAKILDRKANVYNSLTGAAFVMLIICPNNLFDVGFQLSFMAVGGIVFLYKYIYNLFYFKFKLFDWLWALTAVSIAAQLATLPLTLYYFKSFSTYFWLTSSVVTIAAFLLIVGAVLLIAISATPLVSYLGDALNFILKWLNIFVAQINEFPGARIQNINLCTVQVMCLFLVILFLSVWLIDKKPIKLIESLAFGLLFIGIGQWYLIGIKQHETLCVYHVPQASFVQIVLNDRSYWITDKDTLSHADLIRKGDCYWLSDTNIYLEQNTKQRYSHFFLKDRFVGIGNKKGMIVNGKYPYLKNKNGVDIKLDFILVQGNEVFKIQEIISDYSSCTVVVDGSVPECQTIALNNPEQVNLHATNKRGAYVLSVDY